MLLVFIVMLVSKFIDEIDSRLCWSPSSDRVQALLEAEAICVEAIGVEAEAEAVDEIATSTSLLSNNSLSVCAF